MIVTAEVSAAAAANGAEPSPVPNPVDQTAAASIKDLAAPRATGDSSNYAVDQVGVAANTTNISTTAQLPSVLPADPAGPPMSLPGPSSQNAGNGSAGPASSAALSDTPVVSLPFGTTSITNAVTATDQKAAIPPVSDNHNEPQPEDATDATPGSSSPGLTNPTYSPFGTVPASLQAHAANYVGVPPTGGAAIHPAQVIEQAAWAIQVTHSSGQEMLLQLSPPALGPLQVSVAVHDGLLSARLEAQNPTTRQILADNLSQLKDSLTQQGVAFDRIDVRLAASSTGSGGSGRADSSPGGQQEGNIPWDQVQPFAPAERDDPLRNQIGPRGPVSRAPLTSLDVMI
jgi:flagellar hook-length control protein FliK